MTPAVYCFREEKRHDYAEYQAYQTIEFSRNNCVGSALYTPPLRITIDCALNRTIEEWIPLFDDPILAQSALDRLAHNTYHIVIEGESYRRKQRPGQSKTGAAKTPKRRRN